MQRTHEAACPRAALLAADEVLCPPSHVLSALVTNLRIFARLLIFAGLLVASQCSSWYLTAFQCTLCNSSSDCMWRAAGAGGAGAGPPAAGLRGPGVAAGGRGGGRRQWQRSHLRYAVSAGCVFRSAQCAHAALHPPILYGSPPRIIWPLLCIAALTCSCPCLLSASTKKGMATWDGKLPTGPFANP